MSIYLREIGQVELLSPEEEIQLAKRVQAGDEEARQQMIRANLRLVVKIAGDYAQLGLPLLDLISEGNLGLMDAVDRFDPSHGSKLSTYAAWWIKQRIRRALSNQGKAIRLPSHMIEKLRRMRKASERLSHELGHTPTTQELANHLNVPLQTVRNWREIDQHPVSMDASVNEDGKDNLGASMSDSEAKSPAEEYHDRQLLEEMASHLANLKPREREILESRFGLNGHTAESLEDLGARLGITRERVRQIQNLALDKLHKRMLKG